MQKQLSLLTLSIALLSVLSSTHIQSAAELPTIDMNATVALIKAVQAGNLEVAQQALVQGAAIDGLSNDTSLLFLVDHHLTRSTPLQIATENGDLPIVQFLLQQGASVDGKAIIDTPLLEMCRYGNISQLTALAIITELLRHGANVNTQDGNLQYTPLMRAISFLQSEHIAKLLILSGADVTTITNYEGKNALDLIKTSAMRQVGSEAYAIREHAFQQLPALEATLHTQMLNNLPIPIEKLAEKFSPYYTNQGESQPAYNLLNKRIAKQWTPILEKLEIIRLLNQPECLPIQNIAAITADYLFAEQK